MADGLMADGLKETLEALLESYAIEIGERRLLIRSELDPDWRVEVMPGLVAAFRQLLQLVFTTVPDGCEVYLGSARSTASVSRLAAGRVTLRWQVPGARRGASEPGVTPLHPRLGDAEAHARSSRAAGVREAFARAGGSCEIEVVAPGFELVARAILGQAPGGRMPRDRGS